MVTPWLALVLVVLVVIMAVRDTWKVFLSDFLRVLLLLLAIVVAVLDWFPRFSR